MPRQVLYDGNVLLPTFQIDNMHYLTFIARFPIRSFHTYHHMKLDRCRHFLWDEVIFRFCTTESTQFEHRRVIALMPQVWNHRELRTFRPGDFFRALTCMPRQRGNIIQGFLILSSDVLPRAELPSLYSSRFRPTNAVLADTLASDDEDPEDPYETASEEDQKPWTS